jgi:hypothetical protein
MRIGISGSWKEENHEKWSLRSDFETFAQACRQLGKALVDSGVSIVVGSESPRTADRYVVEAYLAGSWKNESIRVVRPVKGNLSFQEMYAQCPEAFRFVNVTETSWRFVRQQFIQEIDAAITIGGGEGTYQVGVEMFLAKKRLVPIASFGGASLRLLNNILNSRELKDAEIFKPLNNPWYGGLTSHVLNVAKINQPLKVLLIHGRARDQAILYDWFQNKKLAQPVVMMQEFTLGQTLPEKFEALAMNSDAAIALATPDDLALATDKVDVQKMRARQNVWVEVGWFWGRLGRENIMLLVRGDVEIPSDLDGIVYYRYESSPLEIEKQIHAFLSLVRENNH